MSSRQPAFPQNGALQGRLSAIVESSDDAIISKDLNGIIQSWNRGAERIFGYTAAEAVGKPISILAAPERADEFPNILERISRGERIDHYQTKRRAKDGRILSISLTVSPIRDASGVIVGASKIARDISDQVRYQQALQEANESLSRANADLEQFAYSASHDLQEPLRMISTYSEMLRRKFGGQIGPGGDQCIDYIVTGVTRMDQLLKDLRAFVQASASGRDQAQDVDAGEALQRALAGLKAAIEDSGASIVHEHLPWVRAHEIQLEQLFQNLVGNAIRYRSQQPPQIHIAAERCGDKWQFSIRDNGIGIDPQYGEQIFGMFKRLHSYTDYPGTGMGLAICQRIVERAGGRIWVESKLGRGSTFLFTIPAARSR
jgi:PAS domain S-box-containing protein